MPTAINTPINVHSSQLSTVATAAFLKSIPTATNKVSGKPIITKSVSVKSETSAANPRLSKRFKTDSDSSDDDDEGEKENRNMFTMSKQIESLKAELAAYKTSSDGSGEFIELKKQNALLVKQMNSLAKCGAVDTYMVSRVSQWTKLFLFKKIKFVTSENQRKKCLALACDHFNIPDEDRETWTHSYKDTIFKGLSDRRNNVVQDLKREFDGKFEIFVW